MALIPSRRGPTAEEREALKMLAGSPSGCSQSIMMAHGLAIGVLHQLVRDGLVMEKREIVLGRRTIVVTRLRITEVGLQALAGK
jgi:hypothetical protein